MAAAPTNIRYIIVCANSISSRLHNFNTLPKGWASYPLVQEMSVEASPSHGKRLNAGLGYTIIYSLGLLVHGRLVLVHYSPQLYVR